MNSIDSVVIYKIVIHSHVHYTHCNLGKVNLRVYMMYEIMMDVHCTYCSVCVHLLQNCVAITTYTLCMKKINNLLIATSVLVEFSSCVINNDLPKVLQSKGVY